MSHDGAGLKLTGIRQGLFVLLLASFLLLSACMPEAHRADPPLDIPEYFSISGPEPLSDQWWLSFNDKSLDSLMMQALSGSLTVRQAWDRLEQVAALGKKAGAGLSPKLDANGSLSRAWTDGDSGSSRSDNHSLGLVAGYELDFWGRVRSSRDAARFDLLASREDLQTTALTLTAQVAEAWYQLVEQRSQLNLLSDQRTVNETILALITTQFRAGKTGIADVLQQKQLLEANRGENALAEARVRSLEIQLAILLGVSPSEFSSPVSFGLPTLSQLPAVGLPAELLKRRPDIRRAFYQVQAADSRVASAVADRFPKISLSAGLSTQGGSTQELFDNWLATLAANLVGPIIDGGQRRAEVDRTRAAAAEQLNRYGQVILEALGEVEDALSREQQQKKLVESLDQQLHLAELATGQVRQRYLKGAENYQRVLTALLSHQSLQRSRLNAARELIQSRINLYRALAGSFKLEPFMLDRTSPVPADNKSAAANM